jgi:hypothetical protein
VLINATLIVARLTQTGANYRAPMIAGAIALIATILYFFIRPTNVTEEALAAVEEQS